jgi:dTDP-4-amino-4,6-dideoxygalactose transaminase
VITTSFTFIATAEAISYVGATPVFVDIDPQTFNLDVREVEKAVNERTKAILPVHLFGQPADLAPLQQLCEQHNLKRIEDCAQSFGARYGEKMTGAIGDAGCFSFFPSKNLGGYGDGGLITTSDDRLAEEIRVLRNHGSRERYHHSVIGYNSRLDELQAVILRVKLKHIDRYNEGRRRNAALYTKNLQGSGVQPPVEDGKGEHVYHQYTILSDRRDHLQQILGNEGIASAIYYPIPLHRQEVYQDSLAQISLPHTEAAARRVLSLPMYPELRAEQVEGICQVIREAL